MRCEGTVGVATHGKAETVGNSRRIQTKDVRVKRDDDFRFIQRVGRSVRLSKRQLAPFASIVIRNRREREPRSALLHELALQTK
jgi:hypothetical protein